MKKQHLPEKVCAGCGRPMRWRRRWAAVWEEVRFCSERCRRRRRGRSAAAGHGAPGRAGAGARS